MGSWLVLPYTAPILPIHAALLRTGKVFFFAGSGNNPATMRDQDLINASAVWQNPSSVTSGTFTRPTTPLDGSGHPYDVFCAGQTFSPEGLLMVAGGTLRYDPFYGLTVAMLFDPGTERWVPKPSMQHGRWYPTLLTLGSGRILAVAGLGTTGQNIRQPEVYSSTFKNGWQAFPATSDIPMYAHLALLQDGRVFFSGGCFGGNNGVTPRILTIPGKFSRPLVETPVPGLVSAGAGNQAATVLLPPAQAQQVMVMGGGDQTGRGENRVALADFTAASPAYTAATPLNFGRMHHSAVLLPDRTVLVCNGSGQENITTSSMLPAEIYNPYDPATNTYRPRTGTWTAVETQAVPRVYHSVALLLPDGRVVAAGGNPQRGVDERRLEVYSPSYMSQPRPVIQSAPTTTTYGGTFTLQVQGAAAAPAGTIKWVSLIRPMATTHSYDTEQRIVDLPITARSGTALTVAVPTNRNLAPPGYYMLVVTDSNVSPRVPNGVPSLATWIRLG